MDAIRSAIQRVENSPTVKKAQKTDKEVDDAIFQLSSAATLLELSSPSRNTFTRLIELCRGRLLPLYRTSLIFTLDYTLAIFSFIHQNKLLGTNQPETRRSWENVLESLFSGILDFLEENSTGKLCDSVASTFYPVLCPVFFVGPQQSAVEFDGSLLSIIYQLLQATVESNAKNASKLRDSNIGSVNFGATIYYTKDFLAMESLLELFALLVPPVKAGRQKRTLFIKEVFDPSLFRCSDQIIQYLENMSNPDWSITSAKIMQALAGSDISFPQPLMISAFGLNGTQMRVSTFYVDKSKFVANLDMDGKIETLHVPFSIIRKISGSPWSNDDIRIVAITTEPPIMGDRPIQNCVEGDQTISWKFERKLLERFRTAASSRGLNLELSARAKQSKADEISLDFQTHNQEKQTPLTLKKDKVQSLSQLWNAGLQTHDDHEIVTSPLAPDFELKRTSRLGTTAPDTPTSPAKNKKDAVFVHSDGNLSFEPRETLTKSLTTRLPNKNPDTQPDDNSEDSVGLPSRSKGFSKKRIISLSDDENNDDLPTVTDNLTNLPLTKIEQPLPKLTSKAIVDDLTHSPQEKIEKRSPKRPKTSKKSTGLVELDEKLKGNPASNKTVATVPHAEEGDTSPKAPENTKKRKSESVTERISLPKENPSKRQRLESPPRHPLSPSRPLPKNRYGRSGRASSPVPAEVDFDEVPHSVRNNEPKASRMKNKSGKALPKAKATLLKKGVEKKKVPDTKDRPQKRVESDPDITLVNVKNKDVKDKKLTPAVVSKKEDKLAGSHKSSAKIAIPETEAKPAASNKSSARVAPIEKTSKPKQKKVVNEVNNLNKSTKPEKAPWERDDFLKHVPSSGDLVDPEPSSKSSNEDEKQVDLVEGSSDNIIAPGKVNVYEEVLIDPPHSPPRKSTPNVVTIDLTHDDSPRIVKHAPVVKHASKVDIAENRREKMVQASAEEYDHAAEREASPSPYIYPKTPRNDTFEASLPRHNRIQPFETDKTPAPKIGNRGENKRLSVNFDLPDDKVRLHTRDREGKSRKTVPTDHRHGREPHSRHNFSNQHTKPKQHHQQHDHEASRTVLSSPMAEISSVLRKINEAVIQNVARRFDDVTDKLNEGQRIIIEETLQALEEMSHTSDLHIEGLMDTELKYRASCAKIMQGFSDCQKTAEQVNRTLKNILAERSARSLCRKFPTKLVPKLPAEFLALPTRTRR